MYRLIFFFVACFFISCNKEDEYVDPVPVSPVVMDLTQVPYQKLSDYHFFETPMSNQKPSYGVVIFKPESELFTDYAQKKRFVWLPSGAKAAYVNDYTILNMPTGSALIKNFYYNNVQPSNTTKIIETRVMIKKTDGWIYANYVWNDEQTEAYLDMNGSTKQITWIDENSVTRTISYEIPDEDNCAVCHTISNIKQPIGVKPQNLNGNFQYALGENSNQLNKWIELGILENNLPSTISSVVNYKDVSKPLLLRVRSYFDSNCAHCHKLGGWTEDFNLRFEFINTTNLSNMGVCEEGLHMIPGVPSTRLISIGSPNNSLLYHRLTTNDIDYKMPMIGRTIVHEEGAQLVFDWISSLNDCQ